MVSLLPLIWALSLAFLTEPITASQSYDRDCFTNTSIPGTNYLCTTDRTPCQTFIVYRAQQTFQTLSSITSLFTSNQTQLLTLNNLTLPTTHNLNITQEILLPINCSCFGQFSHAVFLYKSSRSSDTYSIACETFEGLLKAQTLTEQNPYPDGKIPAGSEVSIRIRCACPDTFETKNGTKYLVTYPVVEGDNIEKIARKFNLSPEILGNENGLDPKSTIFPQTTLLIPMTKVPVLNFMSSPPPVNSSPNPPIVNNLNKVKSHMRSNRRNMFILLAAITFTIILLSVVLAGVFTIIRKKREQNFEPLSARSSQLSKLSPDLLDGMSKLKHTLFSYSLEELKIATGDFSEDSKISNSVYRGRIEGSDLAIEQMSLGEARRVIKILTKVNHVNIVKLQGCCDESRPYLVFEFTSKGSLRDYLSNQELGKELTWRKRMQIAFDITMALHYLHCCTSPSYVHGNINSRNVFITEEWRAKIGGFGIAKPLTQLENEEKDDNNSRMIVGRKGYLAPEYLCHGLASQKVDIFNLGVVLLELISAKEGVDGCMLKSCVGILVDIEEKLEGSSHCVEMLREFMDPSLNGDYPLGDALCLTFLVKGCMEEDPLRRPTVDCVLKALSRMI
ncbi:protein LYK5-like [Tasmannia lanceolata]|uniref:protein LYK5-like n=1 Tax=Tasmannia lanceolata TaxID=3420 RepID=UPI00406405F3